MNKIREETGRMWSLDVTHDGQDYRVRMLKVRRMFRKGYGLKLILDNEESRRTDIINFSGDIDDKTRDFEAYLEIDDGIRSKIIIEMLRDNLIASLGREVTKDEKTYRLYQFSYSLLNRCSEEFDYYDK